MQLALQLLAAAILALIVTIIHGTGVVGMNRLFNYEDRELRGRTLIAREFELMVPMAFCLFVLHTLEILVFAIFYLAAGALHGLEEALYYSASAYTTLGHGSGDLKSWRLVGAFEGLVGFLLIGWSAAIFVTDMERVLRKRTGG